MKMIHTLRKFWGSWQAFESWCPGSSRSAWTGMTKRTDKYLHKGGGEKEELCYWCACANFVQAFTYSVAAPHFWPQRFAAKSNKLVAAAVNNGVSIVSGGKWQWGWRQGDVGRWLGTGLFLPPQLSKKGSGQMKLATTQCTKSVPTRPQVLIIKCVCPLYPSNSPFCPHCHFLLTRTVDQSQHREEWRLEVNWHHFHQFSSATKSMHARSCICNNWRR